MKYRCCSWDARGKTLWLLIACMAILGGAGSLLHGQSRQPSSKEADVSTLSESAREVLSRARPSVVQIKGFFGSNTAQAFHGTGFAVAPAGILLTNYHVVAEQVLYPEKYRLEYRTPDAVTGKIKVLAIDVRHDLAVVQAEGYAGRSLPLNATVPAKGERAYSIGFPLDVGLTITEGVSNGRIEDAFDARIHFSGALNAGMSGGPALNTANEVIGINVAGYRFQQLVSFLVPAMHAKALIKRALEQPLEPGAARKEVETQLRAHGADLLGVLEGAMATQASAGYVLPGKLSAFIDCQAAGDPAPDQPAYMTRIDCAAKAGLYVQQGLATGDLKYSHYVLTTEKLDAWRFAQRLGTLSGATGAYGSRRHVGPFACQNKVVKLQGFEASLMICARNYRRFEGLYDITVRAVSLTDATRGFASHIDMYGVDFDAGTRFVRRYVEAMQRKP